MVKENVIKYIFNNTIVVGHWRYSMEKLPIDLGSIYHANNCAVLYYF